MTLDLNTLFQSYGWQLAIVGLIAVVVTFWLKKPIKMIIDKKCTAEKAKTLFDTIAFLLGFITAVLLSCIYTLVASKLSWITAFTSTDEAVLTYISNVFGAWAYQIFYFNIWKKLGAKKLLAICWKGIKSLFTKALDKNKDGTIDLDDANAVVTGLLKNGKLSIDEVIATISTAVPEAVSETVVEIVDAAGEDASVNMNENIEKLGNVAESIVSAIPQDKLASVATALVNKAQDKAKEVVEDTVSGSANVAKPTRPTIKF